MAITGSEKIKAQKLITKIESTTFDENDIDNLFIKLRSHSKGFPVFREIADFIAHNTIRNKGITQETIESFYLRIQFYRDYQQYNLALDISKPFPAYIIKLMKYQIGMASDIILWERYHLTKKRLINLIDSVFKENKSHKAELKNPLDFLRIFPVINYIMSFFVVHTAYNHEDILREIIGVLKLNHLHFDEILLRPNNDKIIICILLLLNNTTFTVGAGKYGICQIASDKHFNIREQIRPEQDKTDINGYLILNAKVNIDIGGKNIFFVFMIFSTNLLAELWCDESLFVTEKVDQEDMQRKVVEFTGDLSLNSKFQLTRIANYHDIKI
jgi:hypothetical protein